MTVEVNLGAALARALANASVIECDLPRATPDRAVVEKAGAVGWTADRDFLKRTWRPSGVGAQVAPHPQGEDVGTPPGALMCSARLP